LATPAHRYSYELAFGAIPDGLLVCHRCDNPICVRPDHLFLGTALDNVRDACAKGRAVTGTRVKGSATPKLTEEMVRQIRHERATQGTSYLKLAEKYGVNFSAIGHVITRRNWKHVA
jgi:ribosome-binding protein aMBF1 (putative translation factor)